MDDNDDDDEDVPCVLGLGRTLATLLLSLLLSDWGLLTTGRGGSGPLAWSQHHHQAAPNQTAITPPSRRRHAGTLDRRRRGGPMDARAAMGPEALPWSPRTAATVRLLAVGDTNQAPVARRDVARTNPATQVSVFVVGNDSDADGADDVGGATFLALLKRVEVLLLEMWNIIFYFCM